MTNKWQEGDLITLAGVTRKILGVCGKLIFPSVVDNFDEPSGSFGTQQHYENIGWEKVIPEKPLKEIWVNRYPGSFRVHVHDSKQVADESRKCGNGITTTHFREVRHDKDNRGELG